MNGKYVLLFLCSICIFICSCSQEKRIKNINSDGTNIICFGDSLTSGAGASAGNDYPSILAQNIRYPVINAGRAQDTTEDALKRLKSDVLTQDPKLVIVEFGGNDFLRGIAKEETIQNLDTIVQRIQDAGAMVVLAEVRTGLIGDEYLPGFKKITQRRGAYLIIDLLKGIMTNANLKSDYIHPNDEGYKIMAARICKVIKRILH